MPLILKNIIFRPILCIVPRFSLSLEQEWYTPARWARHTCRPSCATPFFVFFGGWAAVYALFPTLVKQREGAPPPPYQRGGQCPLRPLPACRGQPRQYDCLIQRFSLWSGFMALWAGIATPQQAEEIVARQYLDTTLFCCPAGVRSPLPSREDVQHEGERQPPRRGRGRYGYVSTIPSSVGSSGTDTPPWHVSWHGRQSYS